jgi:hypothetical protein
MKQLTNLLFCLAIIVLTSSCSKDNPAPSTTTSTINKYSGSASYGDLLSFAFDATKKSYTITNETTNKSNSGTYEAEPTLKGVYKVKDATSSQTFYAVELSKKFMAANMPTGNTQNKIAVSVTAEIDNTNNWTNIQGDYTYIVVDETQQYKNWGIVRVQSDKTFYGYEYTTNTQAPEDLDNSNYNDGDYVSGTFSINPTNKERLVVNVKKPSTQSWTGFVYATSTDGVIVLDRGEGKGFILAIKDNSTSTLAKIAGTYAYVTDDLTGGNITINSNGSGSYISLYNGGKGSGTLSDIQPCSYMKNLYYGYDGNGNKLYYCLINEILYFILFDSDSNFNFYGVGGKVN